jgi:uncharacterized integral membrane protein
VSEPGHEEHGHARRRWALWLALALLVAYAIAFVLENDKHVNLHFVFATASVSLIWLILLSFALGALGSLLVGRLERRRRRRR